MGKDYPELFYRYAFSGKAKCHDCKNTIKEGQNVYVFEGNIYHGACSELLEDRKRLERRIK